MAVVRIDIVLLLLFSLYLLDAGNKASATDFTFVNHCPGTIYPGTLSRNGQPKLANGGFVLPAGAKETYTAPAGWSGRIWPRTGCTFDASGKGKCITGDCDGGSLQCTAGGAPPVTLAEFTIGDKDFYDISVIDGYNVGVGIMTSGGTGDCRPAECKGINRICPNELKVDYGADGVACKGACLAFNTEEYCCTGQHNQPETCPPTNYSKIFKSACPTAYSYAYDDPSSTFTCSGANYEITFCP